MRRTLRVRRRETREGVLGALPATGAMWLLLLVMLAPLTNRTAWGQFSGPAPMPSPGLNVPVVPTTDPAILYPAARELRLDVGDQVQVHIFGVTDYNPIVRVSLDGTVQIPLGGVVPVIGLTLHQAADAMAARLVSAGMYRDPQVSMQLLESPNQTVVVTGEIHGILNTNGTSRRLYEAIANAGGLTNLSSHMITIERPGVDQPIVVDLGSDPIHSAQGNVPVFPHDTIVVSRVGVVYMLGAFRVPGQIPLQQNTPLTLMQAAAVAQGDLFEGKDKELRIVRTIGLERKMVRVDLSEVKKGKVPDPVLLPDDIVYLPTDAFKAAIKNGGIGTALGLISVLVVSLQNI